MAAVGSIVETRQEMFQVRRPVRTVTLAWTSAAGGGVSGIPTAGGAEGGIVSGEILRVVFIPAGGGAAPTTHYTATLLDGNGVDVLAGWGSGTNLLNSGVQEVCPSVPMTDGTTTSTRPFVVDDVLTLTIAAAGNAKQGTVVIYLK